MALLHDLRKANFYTEGTKNQKTYDTEKVAAAENWQRKHDSQGDYIWETVKTYQIDDQLPLGHGEKSVMLIQCYIRLTMTEVMAICWHMGFSEEKCPWTGNGKVSDRARNPRGGSRSVEDTGGHTMNITITQKQETAI